MSELVWGLFDIWNVIKDMAWQISIVILLVLLCRVFVGKVSKQASYFLWAIVAIRLLVPVMPASDFSIFNAIDRGLFQETGYTEDMTLSEMPVQENTGVLSNNQSDNATIVPEMTVGENVSDVKNQEFSDNIKDISNAGKDNNITHFDMASKSSDFLRANWQFVVWLAGVSILAAYGVISYVALKHKLRFATSNDHRVYEDGHISLPFVLGIVKPRVYLPYHLSTEDREYILMHEKYHIKRRDYLVKILAFGLLSVYWFHPLVWLAYYMMSRDMELSCDEQVLKEFGVEERKAYSTLLLSFACEKRIPLPSPVSFGENDIKSRIKGILNYKKPTFWSLVAILVLMIVLVVSCLTDAKEDSDTNDVIDETYEITDKDTKELAETLFDIKNPYIGDASRNGKLFRVILDELGVTGYNGMELQTSMAPYWISLSFEQEPSSNKMWQVSAMFLALVENANEVRWSFYDEYGDLLTYYVTVDSVNEYMNVSDIKEYAVSIEKIAELWKMLDEKRIYATTASETNTSFLVFSSTWEDCAVEAGLNFTDRVEWENRFIKDGIGYRGDQGIVKNCIYQDFDQDGVKDMIVIIRDTNWDDNIDDKFCIYMNDEPVYVHEISYMGAFWGVTVADIDNDGFREFLFSGDSGGTGGYGFNAIYELLKYKNGTFETMPLPLDEYCEYEEETAGFGIEVYTAAGEGNYTAYCPALDESIPFSIGTTLSEVFEVDTPTNTLVGRECYGFHELSPVLQNGRYYLLAKECIYRTNIYQRMENIGTAYFLLSWEETEGWVVEKFDVLPYGSGIN